MSCELVVIFDDPSLVIELEGTYAGNTVCANGTVSITNTDDTELYSVPVASGGTATQQIPDQTAQGSTGGGGISFVANSVGLITDITYTDTDGTTKTTPYGVPFSCQTLADFTAQQLNDQIAVTTKSQFNNIKPLKTGVTVSVDTGDDGDLERGRLTSWNTLPLNNIYGNTTRFVSITANVIHDCATNLLWYNAILPVDTQSGYYAQAAALNVDGYTGWVVPNMNELSTLINWSGTGLHAEPFMYNPATSGIIGIVSSDSDLSGGVPTGSISLYFISTISPQITRRSKTNNSGGDSIKRAILCRYYE